ncbi:unnamed protein product [Brachionus calyciflorus]|uniref:Rpn family recombination-promoting nuclease/putative transposase n=1 Tax=Brachionus calyciflorus TaxID=104777 RepID=A0A814KD85_9BILA|nr:unnamed protein product [Brachionus calyciflorus]
MLFGNENHKEILISAINSLLNFQGNDQVQEIEILQQQIPSFKSKAKQSIVDVRCRTEKGEELIVEMQREKEENFLRRTQYYMARVIGSKLESGETYSQLPKVYLLALSKQNLFDGYLNDIFYEKTVVPMIQELKAEFPSNLMTWKFYEIKRFDKELKAGQIKRVDGKLPLKEQWLDFFNKCGTASAIPEDTDKVIQDAYKKMHLANWNADALIEYDLMIQSEIEDKIKREKDKKESELKGEKEGELKGEIKGEISKIKDFLNFGLSKEIIVPRLKFLTHEKVREKLESTLTYIQDHRNDSDDEICEKLGLVGDLKDSF